MGLIMPFILSLPVRAQAEPEPEPESTELVLSDDAVEFSGTELKMDFGSTSVNTALYYRPRLVHHLGKTYFNYNDRDSVLPYQQSRLLVFDNERGFDVPRPIGRGRSGAETHSVSTLVADGGRVYSIQEDLHDSPMRVIRSLADYDYGAFTFPFSIGSVLSYAHFVKKADGNFLLWTRGIAYPTTNYYSLHITESSAGFETWGTPRRVSSRPTGNDPNLRHYPFLPWGRVTVGGKIYLVFSCRKDNATPNFYRHHILTTPDSGEDCGKVFSNVEETFSHDFDVSGAFADSVAATNFAFFTADNDDVQGFSPIVGIGPEGQVYTVITGTDGIGYFFKYFVPGEGWTTKEILIGSLETLAAGATASQFSYITAHSHDDIRMVVRIQVGSDVRPYWFKTTNQGTSWQNLGDMRPSFTGTIYPLIPENYLEIANNENFAFLFSREDDVYTGGAMLHCCVAAKGTIQAIPGVEIEPAVSMNYESTGLFHYIANASNLVLSGSNVTTKTDLFGLRDATGVNNPQFDTDHITTNGTTSRFTISATGLASLATLVYMVVARRIPGQLSIFLSLSDTASNNEYTEFQIAADGRPAHRMTNSITLITMAENAITDELDHVLTFIVAGLNTYIRVDGALQLVQYNAGIDTNHYAIAGTGPSSITTVNAVRQGMRDTNSADIFSQTYVKEELLFSGVMPTSEIEAREKKLCEDHGIAFQNQFQIPA